MNMLKFIHENGMSWLRRKRCSLPCWGACPGGHPCLRGLDRASVPRGVRPVPGAHLESGHALRTPAYRPRRSMPLQGVRARDACPGSRGWRVGQRCGRDHAVTAAAVWLAVSTGHQQADNQVLDVERFVTHHGYEVMCRYEVIESRRNGGKDGGEYRRTLKQALDDAHQGKFAVIVVWALDRITCEGLRGAAGHPTVRPTRLQGLVGEGELAQRGPGGAGRPGRVRGLDGPAGEQAAL